MNHLLSLLPIQHLPFAYLDGGSGSMLVQAAIAGVLSLGFIAKNQWTRLMARVQNRSNRNDQA